MELLKLRIAVNESDIAKFNYKNIYYSSIAIYITR